MTKNMEVTILGCGGSDGVPQIGCSCSVCCSENPCNKRSRSSILIRINDFLFLIDAGPDLRQQILKEKISTIDGIFITHGHYDHISGLGDLKLLRRSGKQIPLYGDEETIRIVKDTFPYAFKSSKLYPAIFDSYIYYGGFSSNKFTINPFKQEHGKYYSYGIRIKDFAYSTDVSCLNEAAYDVLRGVKVWIVDCVRYYTSPTHFALDDTVAAILRVKPELAILTHMCHDIDYEIISKNLPSNILIAYDGMKIKL